MIQIIHNCGGRPEESTAKSTPPNLVTPTASETDQREAAQIETQKAMKKRDRDKTGVHQFWDWFLFAKRPEFDKHAIDFFTELGVSRREALFSTFALEVRQNNGSELGLPAILPI